MEGPHFSACPVRWGRACECRSIAQGIVPLCPEFFFGDGSKTMRLGADWMETGEPARPVKENDDG
jgi:hypothetical protein